MSGFHAPGAASHDPLPGTRRVLRNGYPLVDSLMTAVALFIFCVCLAVFNQVLLGIGVLIVFIIFMLIRGTGRNSLIYDLDLREGKKTATGYVLQIVALVPVFLFLMTRSLTGTPAVLLAAVSCAILFVAYYRFLPCLRVEGPDGGAPDLDGLPNPKHKERAF